MNRPSPWLSMRSLALVALLSLTALGAVPQLPVDLEPTLLDDMNATAPVLRVASGARVVRHEVVRGGGRNGSAVERLVLRAPPGASAEVSYPLPRAPILSELSFAVWIRCNHPNARLAVRVELPRSIDPATKAPRTLLVRSDQSVGPDAWQQAQFSSLPTAVERHVRAARLHWKSNIDSGEAVATELVILAPGAPEATELWVDQIAMYGVLSEIQASKNQLAEDAASKIALVSDAIPIASSEQIAHPTPAAGGPRGRARIARIIEWQGEPYSLLAQLGFDTIALSSAATPEELAEAQRMGLQLVCPPHASEASTSERVPRVGGNGATSDPWAAVAAWDLGRASDAAAIAHADRRRRELRKDSLHEARPVLLRPETLPGPASRVADLLLLDRPLALAPQATSAFARELDLQLRLARPGTRVWVALATHNAPGEMTQLKSLRGGKHGLAPLDYNFLLQSTLAAASSQPLGYYFSSDVRLDERDSATQQRRLSLQLVNLRLGLIEPWLASGKATTPARCSRNDLGAPTLLTERSFLVLPLQWNLGSTRPSLPPGGSASFVVPGAAESSESYLLTMTEAERLRTRRIAGGLHIAVDSLPSDALILVTEDGFAMAQVDRYLRRHAAEASAIRTELVKLQFDDAERAWGLLPTPLAGDVEARRSLKEAKFLLDEADKARGAHRYAQAYRAAAQADHLLDELLQSVVDRLQPPGQLGALPVRAAWFSLGELSLALAASQRTDVAWQTLPAGGFEDLTDLLDRGWQRMELPVEGLATGVRLSPSAPIDGDYCLELEAMPQSPTAGAPLILSPPVRISSPLLTIPAGHLLQVRGMVRGAVEHVGAEAPLAIFDSLGGESMAVFAGDRLDWQPFELERAAGADATTQVHLSLRNFGRVHVDRLEMRVVPLAPQPAAVAERPVTTQPRPN